MVNQSSTTSSNSDTSWRDMLLLEDGVNPASRLANPRTATQRESANTLIATTDAPFFSEKSSEVSGKFALSPDPGNWAISVGMNDPEPDDYVHNPDPRRDHKIDNGGTILTARGVVNVGFLILLGLGLLVLFAGYPLIDAFYIRRQPVKDGSYNIGGINSTGQVPMIANRIGLIDPDTPESAKTHKTFKDGSEWTLVFSDEFNTDGRSFYPGDDPYWEAVDLWYWPTNDLEWYNPDKVETKDGNLVFTLAEEEDHGLQYSGGHLSSWNKFCIQGGYVEVNVSLPGSPDKSGLWPATWMMGNLGRAGYGATTDGTWPYSYDSCDWGTLPNQTFNGQPAAASQSGSDANGGALSYLPGQRLSACTCSDDPNHPGPQNSDGSWRGRSAPEIDIFEAQSSGGIGQASQSAQVAPFDDQYYWGNSTTSGDIDIYDSSRTKINSYRGSVTQEACSVVTDNDQQAYSATGGYAVYGVEYKPGEYVTWINSGSPAWTLHAPAIGPNDVTNISQRLIFEEPMYLIMNLGISHGFGDISPDLVFPVTMKVDYIRVYQDPKNIKTSCDPEDHPTAKYILDHADAYNNPNYTLWSGDSASSTKQPWPKNRLTDNC